MIPSAWPLSPFEVFRTPITIRRFTQGFYLNGQWQEGSQINLSSILSTGNIVNITLNGIALSPIAFTTNIAITMGLIQNALLSQPNILQVDISIDYKTITIVPWQPNLSFVNSFVVTGGSIQPTVTILNSPFDISATASVQPVGKDIVLVPEARRDKNVFTMYTSTEIYGITTQNPDQVTIAKQPFTGLVFEVININEWQNNTTFNIINHYKFIMIRLHPLP